MWYNSFLRSQMTITKKLVKMVKFISTWTSSSWFSIYKVQFEFNNLLLFIFWNSEKQNNFEIMFSKSSVHSISMILSTLIFLFFLHFSNALLWISILIYKKAIHWIKLLISNELLLFKWCFILALTSDIAFQNKSKNNSVNSS